MMLALMYGMIPRLNSVPAPTPPPESMFSMTTIWLPSSLPCMMCLKCAMLTPGIGTLAPTR